MIEQNEHDRIVEAFLEIARVLRYRHGGGHIQVSPETEARVLKEASAYAQRFIAEEEDGGRFRIGVGDFATLRALVYAVEACRLLCAADDIGLAHDLLALAVEEVRRAIAANDSGKEVIQ
jgi:hypothetical protein